MKALKQTYLSPENTNCLKGLLALVIVAAHLRNNLTWLNDTIVGQLLTASGYLGVAIFFFFSGYGILFQYKKRGQDYLNSFLRNRWLDIYLKYLLLMVIYLLFHALFGRFPSLTNLLFSLSFGGTLVYTGWYLQAILVLYLLFYLVIKFLPQKKPWLLTVGFVLALVAYCALCFAFRCSILWYQSVLGFFFGLFVAWNKEAIDTFLSKKRRDLWVLVGATLAFCITLLAGHFPLLPLPIQYGTKAASSVFFVAASMLLLRFVNIKNKITAYLGSLSFEIYVIHGFFLNLFLKEPLYINDGIYIAAVFVCSFLAAIPLHKLFALISKKLKKNA